jgi:hypothetical protein
MDVMGRLRVSLACLALACCRSPASSPLPEARADEPPRATGAGAVAVVELFTSEGCSSCPPADAVLADLAGAEARGVFALAFHVDYWDGLGWPDRFALPQSAARQREYARAFGGEGMYTPQMVVDGADEFTGNSRDHADSAVARALARPAGAQLSVVPRRTGTDTIAVDFVAAGVPAGSRLTVAVVQRSATTKVRAGENAGRTLRHANVVRAFVGLALTGPTGSTTIAVRPALARDEGEVIAYVQRARARQPDGARGMPVVAATSAPLP